MQRHPLQDIDLAAIDAFGAAGELQREHDGLHTAVEGLRGVVGRRRADQHRLQVLAADIGQHRYVAGHGTPPQRRRSQHINCGVVCFLRLQGIRQKRLDFTFDGMSLEGHQVRVCILPGIGRQARLVADLFQESAQSR